MTETGKRITVFGGSRCTAEAEEYQEAFKLGRLLVEANFEVCSGGYAGVMEAVSQGAHQAEGQVVGITMNQFKSQPNPYLKTVVPRKDFYGRLERLIMDSDGYVAMRGGMGTVTEISLVWNKLTMRVMPLKPLILLGDFWREVIHGLGRHLVISESDISHLIFTRTAEEAVEILKERLR
jgi:uncharacterized protein (TIGR00725 family)